DIDNENYVYALGQTAGNFPVKAVSGKSLYANNNSGQFIIKLNHKLQDDPNCFSTVFGSGIQAPNISLTAFLVNECNNIYVSGFGRIARQGGYINLGTNNLPVTDNAFQKTTDNGDFYFMVLLNDAQELLYATYFGGDESPGEEHVDGGTSRFDRRGIIYQSVCVGCNQLPTSKFPTTPGAYSEVKNNILCNNAVIKFDLASLLARFTTDSPEFDQPGLTSGCYPLEVVFLNQSIGGKDFKWDFGNGVTSTKKDSILVTYEEPGTYPVKLTATDINTCVRQDTAYGEIKVFDQQFSAAPDDTICYGDNIRLYATGGVSYEWSPAESLDDAFLAQPTASPDTTTSYLVYIQNENGCEHIDTVSISVIPELIVDFTIDKLFSCTDYPQFVLTSTSNNISAQQWTIEDRFSGEDEVLIHQFQDSGRFEIQLKGIEDICSQSKTIEVSSSIPKIPNVFTPNKDTKNEYFQIFTDDPVRLEIFNRWGKPIKKWDDYQNDWNGDNLSSGVYYYIITFPDETTCNGWLHLLR
ncbi:MAG: gliding motility-associated C-terminal domain-containing protein, partial [Cyclobacteriaceae bacterium]